MTSVFNEWVISLFIINILAKIRVVKDVSGTKAKWNDNCDGFYESGQLMKKNKKILLISIIVMIISIAFAIYLTPLDRYTKDLYQLIHQAVYAIGIIMLCLFYYTNIKEI